MVLVLGGIDIGTGFELSFSIFYLGPVALATWYGSRRIGIVTAIVAGCMWYLSDLAAGATYSHPAIPVWNTLVRLGFFLITATLLSSVRVRFDVERRFARTDTLTGVLNRRAFEERLELALALAARERRAIALAYVDVDDFKQVNDRRGHAEGDRVLVTIARALAGSIRRTDAVARLGGDEFALLLSSTEPAGARQLLDKIARSLREVSRSAGLEITCSIGAVTFGTPPSSAAAAIAAADALMYKAKRSGKDALLIEAHPPASVAASGSAAAAARPGSPGS